MVSLHIFKITQELDLKKKFALSDQLFRSGTSIGANIRESEHCESRLDFIHKLKIAAKEAEETKYWLDLIKSAGILLIDEEHIADLIHLQRMLSKSIKTTRANIKS